jgi:hypothetical protein
VTTAIGFQAPIGGIFVELGAEDTSRFFVCLCDAPLNRSIVRRDKAPRARSREGEMPVDFDAATRQCWEMVQRVGVQIAELPLKAPFRRRRALFARGWQRARCGRMAARLHRRLQEAIRQVGSFAAVILRGYGIAQLIASAL